MRPQNWGISFKATTDLKVNIDTCKQSETAELQTSQAYLWCLVKQVYSHHSHDKVYSKISTKDVFKRWNVTVWWTEGTGKHNLFFVLLHKCHYRVARKENSASKKHKTTLRLILYFWGALHGCSYTRLLKGEGPAFSDKWNTFSEEMGRKTKPWARARSLSLKHCSLSLHLRQAWFSNCRLTPVSNNWSHQHSHSGPQLHTDRSPSVLAKHRC